MTDGPRVREAVQAAAGRLRAGAVESPVGEAWRIWADLHHQEPGQSQLDRDLVAQPDAVRRYEAAVRRRAAGEPLPYVTGLAGFRRLTLRADPRALIPRPETEGLVDLLLARAPGGRVVDVGTGSGCLALALADEGRYQAVIGVDISERALALAADNRHRTGLPVHLVLGDLTTSLASASCDAVVSNPPYLTAAEYQALEPSVRDHEPKEALASGEDGLVATRRVLGEARRVLRPAGWLALEIDSSRAGVVARLAGASGMESVTILDDLFGRARYLLARRSEAE